MKQKLVVIFFSSLFSFAVLEFFIRLINFPSQLDKELNRRNIDWIKKNVVLNSYGYRDKEYRQEKTAGIVRIYALGDSYTYGWLVDNPKDTYTEIIEEELNKKIGKKIEVINAANAGFGIKEELARFSSEGKYFYPDLVLVGLNDETATMGSALARPTDYKWPEIIKKLYLYKATLGNYFGRQTNGKLHDLLKKVYINPDSDQWKEFTSTLLQIKKEAAEVNASLVLVLFPHIHPAEPDSDGYDFYEYNQALKKFAEENDISVVDPLDAFLEYPEKEKLVISPVDAHPTIEMNRLVADEILKQFDFEDYLKNHKGYFPLTRSAYFNSLGDSAGEFKRVVSVNSNKEGDPWVYFETKNQLSLQALPLVGGKDRQSTFHEDYLETGKSFAHSNLPGAIMTYYVLPDKQGEIRIKKKLYGFEVIGISDILALRKRDSAAEGDQHAAIEEDYLSPDSVKLVGDEYFFKFKQKKNYKLYEINLKVAVRQIDVSQDGKLESLSKTALISHVITEDSAKVMVPVADDIYPSSWLRFEGFSGGGFDYVYVDGELVKVKKVSLENKNLVIEFDKPIFKGQKVEIYVSSKYKLAPQEKIELKLE